MFQWAIALVCLRTSVLSQNHGTDANTSSSWQAEKQPLKFPQIFYRGDFQRDSRISRIKCWNLSTRKKGVLNPIATGLEDSLVTHVQICIWNAFLVVHGALNMEDLFALESTQVIPERP